MPSWSASERVMLGASALIGLGFAAVLLAIGPVIGAVGALCALFNLALVWNLLGISGR